MNVHDGGVTGPLRWAAINRAKDGEILSGDRHIVRASGLGAILAVVDGLGHGTEAATAAAAAVRVVDAGAFTSLVQALDACHAALKPTRGAVIALVRVDGPTMSWLGVGNIEAMLVRGVGATTGRTRERLASVGGVVGHVLPTPRETTLPVHRGDLLVLTTDGLRSDAMDAVDPLASPEAVVGHLMTTCRTGRDDALAFAARLDGAPS